MVVVPAPLLPDSINSEKKVWGTQMNRIRKHVLAVAAIVCGLFIFSPARVMSQTVVNRADWTSGVNLPSYITMQIYVPKNLAPKPPIVVSNHACQSSVSGQIAANAKIKAMVR
jgi:hypothetical protein